MIIYIIVLFMVYIIIMHTEHYNSSVASSTSPEEGGSGYSVATVIISVGITISSITIFGIVLLVIIAFLLLRHVKKSRYVLECEINNYLYKSDLC